MSGEWQLCLHGVGLGKGSSNQNAVLRGEHFAKGPLAIVEAVSEGGAWASCVHASTPQPGITIG